MDDRIEFDTDDVILFFDGVCNLCTDAVTFVLRHEKDQIIRFSPLQSDKGQRMQKLAAEKYGKIDSFLLVKNGNLHTKSTAALLLADHLVFPYRLCRHFMVLPIIIRDNVYDFVAKHRYKFFGKKSTCMVPTPELKARFI